MYSLEQTVAPSQEPLRLAEVKRHLRISHSDEDIVLRDVFIPAAREFFEARTGRQLINATWELSLDRFPTERILLPKPPTSSVTSVKYTDNAGTEQTWSSSLYTARTNSEPGEIYPNFSEVWPEIRREPKAVRVLFVAGYGATNASVPEAMRACMLMMVQHWYENRSAVEVGVTATEVPMAVDALLAQSGFGDEFLDYDLGF